MTTVKTTPKKSNNNEVKHQRSKARVITNKEKRTTSITESPSKIESNLSLGEVFSKKLRIKTKLPLYKLSSMKNLLLKNNNHKPDHGSHQANMSKAIDKLRVDMQFVDALKLVHKHETPRGPTSLK